MDEEGHVALTDFGMSKLKEAEEDETYVICTPQYAAPEVLREGAFSFASDWWSLGILLYEMVVGIPPYYSNNRDLMVKLILEFKTHYPKKIEISDYCKNLIDSLLSKDPCQRLGAKGIDDIKSHPWFHGVNWRDHEDKKILPPFKPQNFPNDPLAYFDVEYIQTAINSYTVNPTDPGKKKSFDEDFKDFAYSQPIKK